jgi:hypothetical protein
MKKPFALPPEQLVQARQLWESGRSDEAGELIFEALPFERRPHWAASVLQATIDRSKTTCPEIDHVISIALSPRQWWRGHDAFTRLRLEVLKLDELRRPSPCQADLLRHLVLAELVAKVTYNGTCPSDEFDEDSGWWIASHAKAIFDSYESKSSPMLSWPALCLQGPASEAEENAPA